MVSTVARKKTYLRGCNAGASFFWKRSQNMSALSCTKEDSAQKTGAKNFVCMSQESKFDWGQQKKKKLNGQETATVCNALRSLQTFFFLMWLWGA